MGLTQTGLLAVDVRVGYTLTIEWGAFAVRLADVALTAVVVGLRRTRFELSVEMAEPLCLAIRRSAACFSGACDAFAIFVTCKSRFSKCGTLSAMIIRCRNTLLALFVDAATPFGFA